MEALEVGGHFNEVLWMLLEVYETRTQLVEARGNFHQIPSWELQLIGVTEISTSTDSANFRLLPWKLLQTSMEVNLLPIYFHRSWRKLLRKLFYFHGSIFTAMEASTEVRGNFHGSRSLK